MGSPKLTFIFNLILWSILSALLMEIGLNLYQKSKDIKKINIKYNNINFLQIVIGYILIIFIIIYIILILLHIIPTIEYFPHNWLSEDALHIDLSILFNIILIYLMLNISYRAGSRLIGRVLKQLNNVLKSYYSSNNIKIEKRLD